MWSTAFRWWLIQAQSCASRLSLINTSYPNFWLPQWLSSEESTCQGRRCTFDPWVRKIPWRRRWQPTPAFLPGKAHGLGSLAGYSPWGCKRVGHNLETTRQSQPSFQPQFLKNPTCKVVHIFGKVYIIQPNVESACPNTVKPVY